MALRNPLKFEAELATFLKNVGEERPAEIVNALDAYVKAELAKLPVEDKKGKKNG